MQLTLQGKAGSNYTIEISTDLVHWSTWCSQMNSNGTFSVTDTNAANCPAKFYRAVLTP
jgi:hypothetical protein